MDHIWCIFVLIPLLLPIPNHPVPLFLPSVKVLYIEGVVICDMSKTFHLYSKLVDA